ncbi:hypothetical protein [Kordiimonas sp. SCSIO 12610]|uniref:hypothetical protein n=1 Tax=Kordiimonas sp. SCSIO 12610 TaxID=2829597 RepID=UPI00210939A1|nr:hypothetical protein [Kordiimonas sp. SCSIO 12610]UTW53948.1 hypothetical protein KFF44_08845 [Kordiimonas sp. SCSIO 12610]
MQDLEFYLDKAKSELGLTSDRQLSSELKVTGILVGNWRRGMSLPTDENMVALAKLANEPVELALMHLNFWRSARRNETTAASFYKKLVHMASVAALSLCFIFGFIPAENAAHAADFATENERPFYIMGNN